MIGFQIGILVFECFVVSVLLLYFYKLRTSFGLNLILIALGVFQFFQIFLTSSFQIDLSKGLAIDSGSVVLFSASLFIVLLIYIREGQGKLTLFLSNKTIKLIGL